MKTIILCTIYVLLLVVTISNAKRLFYDNDNDMELTDRKARMFLRSMLDNDDDDDSTAFDTRGIGRNCVACKFDIIPCCSPNICIKKRFRPDECMEIKTGK